MATIGADLICNLFMRISAESIAVHVYRAMETQRIADERTMRNGALRARQEANRPWPVAAS